MNTTSRSSRSRVEEEDGDENEVEEKSKQKLILYFGFGFFSYPSDTIQSFCSRDSSRTKVHFVSNVTKNTQNNKYFWLFFCFKLRAKSEKILKKLE